MILLTNHFLSKLSNHQEKIKEISASICYCFQLLSSPMILGLTELTLFQPPLFKITELSCLLLQCPAMKTMPCWNTTTTQQQFLRGSKGSTTAFGEACIKTINQYYTNQIKESLTCLLYSKASSQLWINMDHSSVLKPDLQFWKSLNVTCVTGEPAKNMI